MPAPRAREAPSTILVADEDPRIVELVAVMLRGAGYRVVTAVAPRVPSAEAIDLIVADESVCAAIAVPAGPPLLVMSATADGESGSPHVVGKPFHLSELLAKVQGALQLNPRKCG